MKTLRELQRQSSNVNFVLIFYFQAGRLGVKWNAQFHHHHPYHHPHPPPPIHIKIMWKFITNWLAYLKIVIFIISANLWCHRGCAFTPRELFHLKFWIHYITKLTSRSPVDIPDMTVPITPTKTANFKEMVYLENYAFSNLNDQGGLSRFIHNYIPQSVPAKTFAQNPYLISEGKLLSVR